MNLDYAKNSIEEVPFGQYLEQFHEPSTLTQAEEKQ